MTDAVRDYSQTLFLPKTDFPMRAGLPQREPEILKRWQALDMYGRLRAAAKGRARFVLHDGPPYANGNIHIGHALNKILKDVIVKYKAMTGNVAPYVPGWDCHGLPIELQVEKNIGRTKKLKMTKPEIRRLCKEYAEKYVSIQREEFKTPLPKILHTKCVGNILFLQHQPDFTAGGNEG